MKKGNVSPEVSAYFSAIGKKSGEKLKKERGSEYFSRISKMRKKHGPEKVKDEQSGSETQV